MSKLKFSARNLIEKLAGRGLEIAQPSRELFTLSDPEPVAPEKTENLAELSFAQDSNLGILERTTPIRRTPSFSPWIGADFFICITVKEAFDLSPAVPVPPATCDSFVRVTLSRPGSLPLEEAETRVITRNSYPMWEESLPFPLDYVTEDMHVVLRVLDKDIGHFNSFLGTVSIPVKDVLASIRKIDQGKVYRLPLQDRQNNVKKRGELLFEVAVVAKQEYKEMRGFISSIQDPDTVHDSLRGYCLHVKLHRLKELSGLSGPLLASLVVEVSVCSYGVRKQLVGQLVGGELDPEALEVVVPLGRAFRDGDTLKGKDRTQFGEVRVELLAGRTRLAKTQVPIWDVPVRSETIEVVGDDEESDGEFEARAAERRRHLKTTVTAISDQQVAIATASSPAAIDPSRPRRPNGRISNTGMAPGGPTAATVSPGRNLSPDQAPQGSPLRRTSEQLTGAAAGRARRRSESGVGSPGQRGGPRPLWDGKQYSRKMERLDRCLTRAPVAVLSMQLVKEEPDDSVHGATTVTSSSNSMGGTAPAGGSGGTADVFDGVDVDVPAEPLVPPAFEGTNVADFAVGMGPSALLKLLLGDGSELATRVWMLEKVTDLKIGPWVPDPDSKAILSRTLSYNKPTPVGMTPVQSQQKIVLKNSGGWVCHQYVTPHVPSAGQCVRVFGQIVGQHAGPNRTRMTADIKLEWFKSGIMVNVVKGKVEDATPKDTRKYFETLKKELAAKVPVEDADGNTICGAAAAAATAAAAAAGTLPAQAGGASAAHAAAVAAAASAGVHHLPAGTSAVAPPPPSVVLLVGLGVGALLAVLLAVLVVRVGQLRGDVARSARALEGLSREVEGVGRALEALAGRLAPAAAGARR